MSEEPEFFNFLVALDRRALPGVTAADVECFLRRAIRVELEACAALDAGTAKHWGAALTLQPIVDLAAVTEDYATAIAVARGEGFRDAEALYAARLPREREAAALDAIAAVYENELQHPVAPGVARWWWHRYRRWRFRRRGGRL